MTRTAATLAATLPTPAELRSAQRTLSAADDGSSRAVTLLHALADQAAFIVGPAGSRVANLTLIAVTTDRTELDYTANTDPFGVLVCSVLGLPLTYSATAAWQVARDTIALHEALDGAGLDEIRNAARQLAGTLAYWADYRPGQ
jgi:hypothetical protein